MNYCSECKKEISDKATTCSATCRKHRQRRKAEAKANFNRMFWYLEVYRRAIKDNLISEKTAIAELIRIKDEINDLLLLANEENAKARVAMMEGLRRRIG